MMSFNPDRAKQAHKVIFSRKTNKIVHSPLYFNNPTVKLTHTQKQLGVSVLRIFLIYKFLNFATVFTKKS